MRYIIEVSRPTGVNDLVSNIWQKVGSFEFTDKEEANRWYKHCRTLYPDRWKIEAKKEGREDDLESE